MYPANCWKPTCGCPGKLTILSALGGDSTVKQICMRNAEIVAMIIHGWSCMVLERGKKKKEKRKRERVRWENEEVKTEERDPFLDKFWAMILLGWLMNIIILTRRHELGFKNSFQSLKVVKLLLFLKKGKYEEN